MARAKRIAQAKVQTLSIDFGFKPKLLSYVGDDAVFGCNGRSKSLKKGEAPVE
jgi:hypothetical protein